MRLPTFTDLYYNGPSNIGNPSLKAEEAVTTEAGIKFTNSNTHVSLAGFNRQSNNLIDWARTDATQKWQPLNVNNVTFRGIETTVSRSFLHILKQLSASYTFIDANFNQPESYTSRYTLSNIRHQLIGIAKINWFRSLNHTITVKHIERVGMCDYTLVDSKLGYTFGNRLTVYTDVSNIFDTDYVEAGYVTMPGRWFKVGFDIKLNY
jgi:vitamin B12 transporter